MSQDREIDARTAALIAGALAGDLDESEREALAALAAADPAVGAELEALGGVADALGRDVPAWREQAPSGDLRERVVGVGAVPAEGATAVAARPVAGRARRRTGPWALAACVAAGAALAVGGLLGAGFRAPAPEASPPQGPPGTLGAVEDVDLDGGPAAVDGASIDAVLVAHTWGTETVLEVEGLPPGEGYDVVLIGDDGREYDSGSFLGSAVAIDCRMNAAVMRAEVDRLEIRQADGGVVTAAALPEAVDDRG
ncbi:hypothetical protein [Litorihabitans aurantiacus]|uniref:Anti-sigma factor n=1 Tax=Litorihabitans aurantiacus TaxID=1930061 RepID=A0AA37UGS5_9MICO|nr:hypothetical protein [Litorihabitans aurantiacus]GMA30114.1 hypothetical protein GCM10025875_01060 [Litorihabitans aurantiacus]